jgi:hypothetical protein
VTTIEAIDALENFVKGHRFPRNRSYQIERMEDAATAVHYTVSLFFHGSSGWKSVGFGSTLADAAASALARASKT